MTRKYKTAVAATLVASLLVSAPAVAVSLDGFGTLGAVHSDEKRADFVGDLFDPDGAGQTRQWSSEVDSRLGLQLSGELTDRLEGVVQVVAEQRYDEHYTPTVEWANLQYEIVRDLSVRAGRLVLPVFMTSEYRKVGYAQPWVRPPQEVYQSIPFTNIDGVDLTYHWRVGEFNNDLRAAYGRKSAKIRDASDIVAEGAFTVANEFQRGPVSLFLGYSRARVTWDEFQGLFDGFRAHGAEGEAIADRYELDGKRSEIVSLGTRYDPGQWFAMAEWARTEHDSFLADSRAWYATAGYRIGVFTPYLTLAGIEATSPTSHPGIGEPQLDAELNALLGSAAEQESIALGTRWDFAPSAAAKIQLDYLDLDEGSPGVLKATRDSDFDPGGIVRVVSVSLDFVF